MDWFIWLWLGIFVAALLFEFITADMVSIWFSIAAIPSFILALLLCKSIDSNSCLRCFSNPTSCDYETDCYQIL